MIIFAFVDLSMDKIKDSPSKIMWLSIGASILTIGLKGTAYFLTDSVGLLSDALESFINLAAGIVALIILVIAFAPADKEHPFGHHKAEYFSSVLEGTLILFAAIVIGVTSVQRLLNPKELEGLGIGLIISAVASAINWLTARILFKAAKKYNSITIEADAHHLMSDVFTTGGVIIGLILVTFTKLYWLDSVIAILVAINIIFTGIKLIKASISGLMDSALPKDELKKITALLDEYERNGLKYHALYTRKASSKKFITFHLLMPGDWTIGRGHQLTKDIERDIKSLFPESDIFIHLEPINDPDAFDDYL